MYGEYLHNMQFDIMPENGIKGRGLAVYEKRILEYQTALAIEAENDYKRMELISNQCEEMYSAWKGKVAEKIPEIPEKPIWSEFEKIDEFCKMVSGNEYLPIGYDSDSTKIYGIPLREIYSFLIMGDKKTGKTNLMKICIQSAIKKKSKLYIIDSPAKDLNAYSNLENITYITQDQEIQQCIVNLKSIFLERNKKKIQLLQEGFDEDAVFEQMCNETPYFVFISELSWFASVIYKFQEESAFAENIAEKGFLHNIYFISELSLENVDASAGYAICSLFASYKTGIHLGGQVSRNQIFSFEYLSYKEQEDSEKLGIGQLPGDRNKEGTRKVVIPDARK